MNVVAQTTVAAAGAGGVLLSWAWFGLLYRFSRQGERGFGVVAADYNSLDHAYSVVNFVAAMTTFTLVLTAVRSRSWFEDRLHPTSFAVLYCVVLGTTQSSLVVAYAHALITLPKFNAIYKDVPAFAGLVDNRVPTAAFLAVTVFQGAAAGYTFATNPSVRFTAIAAAKDVSNI